MNISQLKELMTNRVASLDLQRVQAFAMWDVDAVNRIDIELEETKQTINQLG